MIDSNTDQPIPEFDSIPQNALLDPSKLPSTMNIRANIDGPVQSVEFINFDPFIRYQTENYPVYALFGNQGSNYRDGTFPERVLTVENVPVPTLPIFDATVQDSQPILTWNADPNTMWMQVYIGQKNGGEVYRQWHEVSTLCRESVCTLLVPVVFSAGEYEVYLQPWGASGFSPEGIEGWGGPDIFIIAR